MWSAAFDTVRFDEALAWFGARVPITAQQFASDVENSRRRAFWIAGVTQADVIRDVFDSLDKALADGVPFEEWRDSIGPKLARAWSGYLAPEGQPARLETIMRNWAQNSYARARWEQMDQPAIKRLRPFRMFDAVRPTVDPSPICTACNGTILEADHPWWQTHRPPLHHRCQSGVRALTEEQAYRMGVTIGPPRAKADEGWGTGEAWAGPDRAKYLRGLKPPVAPKAAPPPPPVEPPPLPPPPPTPPKRPEKVFINRAHRPTDVELRLELEQAGITPPRHPYHLALHRQTFSTMFGADMTPENVHALLGFEAAGVPCTYQMAGDLSGASEHLVFQVLSKSRGALSSARRYTRDAAGVWVYHEHIELARKLQKTGLGAKIVANQVQAYREAGLTKIELSSAAIGRYYWPRLGFVLSGESAAAKLEHHRKALASFLLKKKVVRDVDEALRATATLNTIHEIATYRVGERKVGKEYLLSDLSLGDDLEMPLQDGAPEFERMKAQLGLLP